MHCYSHINIAIKREERGGRNSNNNKKDRCRDARFYQIKRLLGSDFSPRRLLSGGRTAISAERIESNSKYTCYSFASGGGGGLHATTSVARNNMADLSLCFSQRCSADGPPPPPSLPIFVMQRGPCMFDGPHFVSLNPPLFVRKRRRRRQRLSRLHSEGGREGRGEAGG